MKRANIWSLQIYSFLKVVFLKSAPSRAKLRFASPFPVHAEHATVKGEFRQKWGKRCNHRYVALQRQGEG
jgi:hypothetical protein